MLTNLNIFSSNEISFSEKEKDTGAQKRQPTVDCKDFRDTLLDSSISNDHQKSDPKLPTIEIDEVTGKEIVVIDSNNGFSIEFSSYRDVGYNSSTATENRLTAPVSIGPGKLVPALIDTGAAQSLLHVSMVKDCNLCPELSKGQQVKGFGNHNVSSGLGTVSAALLIHGQPINPIEF